MLARCSSPPLQVVRWIRTFASGRLAAVYGSHGVPADVLQLQAHAADELGDDHVLLDMIAAPINPSDINQIEGKYPIRPPLPAVAGNEGLGVVCQAGKKVQGLSEGDWVVPLVAGQGTWRQSGVFPAADWHRVPATLPMHLAATLAVNPVSAMRMLEEFVQLNEGDAIVQNGANSAVGRAVIQLAHVKGVHTINVVRDRPNMDELKEELAALGASLVTTEQQLKEDLKVSGLPRPQLGLNCVGGSSSAAVAKALGPSGTLVTYGGMSMKPVTLPTSLLIFKDLRARGFWLSCNDKADTSRSKKAGAVDRIIDLAQKGQFHSTAIDEMPFSDVLGELRTQHTSKRKQLLVF